MFDLLEVFELSDSMDTSCLIFVLRKLMVDDSVVIELDDESEW